VSGKAATPDPVGSKPLRRDQSGLFAIMNQGSGNVKWLYAKDRAGASN
jgi:hypothetical protein